MAKRQRQYIPERHDQLTVEWFGEVLEPVAGGDHRLSAVRCEDIGTDIGFMGEVYRCHLSWTVDGGQTSADRNSPPASVIVKLPTGHDVNFALGDALQLYEREIVVYETLRPSMGAPMPEFYYGAMDPDPAPWVERGFLFLFDRLSLRGDNWVLAQLLKLAGKSKRRYILVLEDIVDARPPTQRVGGSLDDALAALGVLAQFHATNWMRTDPIESYNRIWPLNRASKVYQANYLRNRSGFVDRFGPTISADTMNRLDDIQTRVPAINAALTAEPWTLLHGDYRLDNLLFRSEDDLVVLDWQGLAYGRPAFDVAYFITTALTAEHRDDEERLLRAYHDALMDEGIDDYPWQQLIDDCGMVKEMLAHRIVGAADILDTELVGATDDGDGALSDVLQLRVLGWLD